MSIIETIEKAHFLATEAQVETLTVQIVQGAHATGTYLKILVASCQAVMKGKRLDPLKVIADVDARFYPAVLRAVGPDDMDIKERTRRASFAQTSVSELRSYVKAGGNLKLLDAATVSKHSLRVKKAPESTNRSERIFHRARDAIIRRFRIDAKRDLSNARDELVEIIEALQAELDRVVDAKIASSTRVTSVAGLTRTRHPDRHAEL